MKTPAQHKEEGELSSTNLAAACINIKPFEEKTREKQHKASHSRGNQRNKPKIETTKNNRHHQPPDFNEDQPLQTSTNISTINVEPLKHSGRKPRTQPLIPGRTTLRGATGDEQQPGEFHKNK